LDHDHAVNGTQMPAERTRDKDTAWYHRYRRLRLKLALLVGGAALIFAAMWWIGKKALAVTATSGVPLGECVRTDRFIATLLQATDPQVPEITGRGGNTTASISLLLIPLDGSDPKKILIAEELTSNQYALAKLLGSDGSTLWFDVNGLGGVDLRHMNVLEPADIREPDLPKATSLLAADPDHMLSAGLITTEGSWFGLHSEEDLTGEFAVKKFVRRVVPQENAKRMRRLYRGQLDAPVDDRYHRILALEPINEDQYFNAAFLRMDDASEPLRLTDPDGLLMIHTSEAGLHGTAIISRVDLDGHKRWSVDTAIDRFKLTQILPGERSFAFVGTRLPVPGKVSEPIVVIVENASGRKFSHSLWQ
jgi:hypothetical protein